MHGEKLCVSNGWSVAVISQSKIGDFIKFEVLRTKDGIIVGKEV
jgi:uncharacterized Fe-S cluster-containing radical SAM superfamily enzyme